MEEPDFSPGMKWGFVPKDPTLPKYFVCNCDESEPGTFKDHLIIMRDPHQVIRGDYAGQLGDRGQKRLSIAAGNFSVELRGCAGCGGSAEDTAISRSILDIVVHPGAGAYIAGEETALLNSLEGYQGDAADEASLSGGGRVVWETDSD